MDTFSIRDVENARLAGFFDGEGCIGIAERKSQKSAKGSTFCLYMNATQLGRHSEPLRSLQEMFGGSIYTSQGDVMAWRVGGPKALKALSAMFPYLQVKQKQAFVGIAFQCWKRASLEARGIGKRLSDNEIRAGQVCKLLLHRLNRPNSQGMAPSGQNTSLGSAG